MGGENRIDESKCGCGQNKEGRSQESGARSQEPGVAGEAGGFELCYRVLAKRNMC
jgi:hypothetical protein